MQVTFDESYPKNVGKGVSFQDAGVSSKGIFKDTREGIDHPETVEPEKEEGEDTVNEKEESPIEVNDLLFSWKISKDHPFDIILVDITKGVTTCSKISNLCFALVSQIEPKNEKEALLDDHWLMAIQDELNQFKRNDM